MNNLAFKTIKELKALVNSGAISHQELLKFLLIMQKNMKILARI